MKDKSPSLILRFLDENPSFAYGFEAGQTYAKFKEGKDVGSEESPFCYNSINTEQYILMAECLGYNFYSSQSEVEGWSYAIFTKSTLSIKQPPILTIVK